jgi:acetolactate synthase-1/2/3 large subunit
MPEIPAGQLVARQCKTEGVKYLFTLSGGHISPLYDGFLTEGLGVIDFRHEQAAVHAAEGWAKVTGIPGVAAITAGPGANGMLILAIRKAARPSRRATYI